MKTRFLSSVLLVMGLAASSVHAFTIYQSPEDDGVNPGLFLWILEGTTGTLNVYFDHGTVPSAEGQACSGTGSGDEYCMWDVEFVAVGDMTFENFVPDPSQDLVFTMADRSLRINGGDPIGGSIGIERIGTIHATVAPGGTGGAVGVRGLGESIFIDSAYQTHVIPTATIGAPLNCDPLVLSDQDGDGVHDLCDNCVGVFNPRLGTLGQPFQESFQTMTGGQLDDDADGYGNQCDPKYLGGTNVGGVDLFEMLASFNKDRSDSNCGSTGDQSCAKFDLDNLGQFIGGGDLNRSRLYFNLPPGPKCFICPLECSGPACP